MTIIFNFCSLAAAVICLGAGDHLRRAFNRSKIIAFKDYSYAFIFVGLGYIILALPGLKLFDPFLVQIDFILVDTFFLLAILFFGPATFSFSGKAFRFKEITVLIILGWLLIYIFLNIFFFSPAIPLKIDNIVYYWKSGTPWIQAASRALLCFVALIIAIFFLRGAKFAEEKTPSKKSFLIGLSSLMIFTAGFILWFSPFFYFSPKLLVFSGLIGVSGFIMGAIMALLLSPQKRVLW